MLSVEGNWTLLGRRLIVVSVMAQHLKADARLKGKKGSRLLPHLIRRRRTDSEQVSSKREGSSSDNRGEFRAVKDIVQAVSKLHVRKRMHKWQKLLFSTC